MSRAYNDYTARTIADFFQELRFPCSRDELVSYAQRRDADWDVVQELRHLPEHRFDSLDEVVKDLNRIENKR